MRWVGGENESACTAARAMMLEVGVGVGASRSHTHCRFPRTRTIDVPVACACGTWVAKDGMCFDKIDRWKKGAPELRGRAWQKQPTNSNPYPEGHTQAPRMALFLPHDASGR